MGTRKQEEEFLDAMQEWQKRTPPNLEYLKSSPDQYGQLLQSLMEMLIQRGYKTQPRSDAVSSDVESSEDTTGSNEDTTSEEKSNEKSAFETSTTLPTAADSPPFNLDAVQSILQIYTTLLSYPSAGATDATGVGSGGDGTVLSIPTIVGQLASVIPAGCLNVGQLASLKSLVHSLLTVDVCAMLGFKTGSNEKPYCGLTNGASEAVLSVPEIYRDIKLLPFSIRYFLKENEKLGKLSLDPGRKMSITQVDGNKVPIMDATAWDLYNLPTEDVLSLPSRLAKACKAKSFWDMWAGLYAYLPKFIGLAELTDSIYIHDKSVAAYKGPLLVASVLANSDWASGMARSGLGSGKLCHVELDADGRMCIDKLKHRLDACLAAKIPVLAVVATLGNSQLGTIDALNEILLLRAVYQKKGLYFNVHADATYGGHFMSTIRKDYDLLDNYEPAGRGFFQRSFGKLLQGNSDDHFTTDVRSSGLSDFIVGQLRKIPEADSVTVDLGHHGTTGGAYMFLESGVRLLVQAPPVGTGAVEPDDGLEETMEGSTIRLSELYGAFMHFRFIKPTMEGTGSMLARATTLNKVFFIQLLQLGFENKAYEVIPLIPKFRLNANGTIEDDQKEIFKIPAKYVDGGAKGLTGHPKALSQLRTAGSDLATFVFAFNPKNPKTGARNVKWFLFQKFNEAIREAFQKPATKPRRMSMAAKALDDQVTPGATIVKSLSLMRFDSGKLGQPFLENITSQIGLHSSTAPNQEITELAVFKCEDVFTEKSINDDCDTQAVVLEALERIDQGVKEACSIFKNEKI